MGDETEQTKVEEEKVSAEEVRAMKLEIEELRARAKVATDSGEVDTLRKELAELQGKGKGEIRGMSESSAHALFEGMQKLTAQLEERARRLEDAPPAETDSWLPAFLR